MQPVAVCCLMVMWLFLGCLSEPEPNQIKKNADDGGKDVGSDVKEPGARSKCATERRDVVEIARRQNSEVIIPECNQDGTYNEIQCHTSTGYCWCVTRDGRHIPGTSVKDKRPWCKSKRKKRKGRGGKTKKRKACNSKDRQTFNTALIKVFKEEYDRVNVTPPPTSAPGLQSDEFGTEKAIVIWKYNELDANKDGQLKFKEIRKFGKMVKKLIKPKPCAKRFLDFCDKNADRSIEKTEWTLCLGVDIKPGATNSAERPVDTVREELMIRPSSALQQTPDLPALSSGPSSTLSAYTPDKQERKETSQNCKEERETALNIHSQEPNAKHYIPACTPDGLWENAQCHQSTGYCWCVKEDTGNPIPGTATYRIKPNCTFDNERELQGCPFDQKRRFLVDLLGDLTEERRKALLEINNQTNTGPEDNLSLRETVVRWKLKLLDTNNNGVLERSEWRPFRRTTLKNKNYPRKCRRSFLRYCDENKNNK
uniref:SPARC-related modular calcium-binding protein 1 n=1 Tax=Arion vulgaris TaxID=1028688 RepID=A0A0B7BBY1_9EUPU